LRRTPKVRRISPALRALHLNIFEQPQTSGSRNIIFDLELEL
jgi:hypothetical protein